MANLGRIGRGTSRWKIEKKGGAEELDSVKDAFADSLGLTTDDIGTGMAARVANLAGDEISLATEMANSMPASFASFLEKNGWEVIDQRLADPRPQTSGDPSPAATAEG